MKATGIVRRIDDLGRIVVPKEIRRTLRIREGDPLEIFNRPGGRDHSEKVFANRGAEPVCGRVCGKSGADNRTSGIDHGLRPCCDGIRCRQERI